MRRFAIGQRHVHQRLERQLQDVADEHLHVASIRIAFLQPSGEPPIDLDQVEPARVRRERVGERAESRTDLEHRRLVRRRRQLDDAAHDAEVAQEVLAPALAWPKVRRGERFTCVPPHAH
jgi:hypothetical protein